MQLLAASVQSVSFIDRSSRCTSRYRQGWHQSCIFQKLKFHRIRLGFSVDFEEALRLVRIIKNRVHERFSDEAGRKSTVLVRLLEDNRVDPLTK